MTNKVVSKTFQIFYTKRKIFRKKFELNFISSYIIFDFSDTFLWRHDLHSVDFVCIVEARSASRIWEARCLHSRGSWRPGVPSLLGHGCSVDSKCELDALFYSFWNICPKFDQSKKTFLVLPYLSFSVL